MTISQQLLNAQKQLSQLRLRSGIECRPTLTVGNQTAVPSVRTQTPTPTPESETKTATKLFHHGDVAVAALRAGESCHYQLWLALRYLDTDGRGWLLLETVQSAVCNLKGAPETHLYKKPRLRQLLAEGNGRYWRLDRANQRVFVRREAHIAAHLGVMQLTGRHVAITTEQIFSTIQVFRAHSFGAWLANRKNPISQATIERLTGIPARSQLRYCQLAGVTTTANISIGPRYSRDNAQECAWRHEGTFKFADYRGKQGPAGRRYVAWHLPTSYSSTAATSSRRRQKRTNNHLADLRHNRDAGNSHLTACFFHNGAMAAKAANRQTPDDVAADLYWPTTVKVRSKKTQLWHAMAV